MSTVVFRMCVHNSLSAELGRKAGRKMVYGNGGFLYLPISSDLLSQEPTVTGQTIHCQFHSVLQVHMA